MNEWAQELGDELPPDQIDRIEVCIPLIPSRTQLRATIQAPGLPPLAQLALRLLSVTGIRPQELSHLEVVNDTLQVKNMLAEPSKLTRSNTLEKSQTPSGTYPAVSGGEPSNLGRSHTFEKSETLSGTYPAVSGLGRPLGADFETIRQFSQLDQPLQIEPQQLQDWLNQAASHSGLQARFDGCQRQLRPTVYRHAYARDCLQQGIDLYALKQLLGHAELKTTQRYIPTALADCQGVYCQTHPLMLPAPASATTRGGGPQANLTIPEVLALIAAPAKARDRLMLRLLYATGLRASELLELRPSDIDVHDHRLFIRGGKGGQDRYAILDPQSLEQLKQYAQKQAKAQSRKTNNIMPADRPNLFITNRAQLFIIVKRAAKAIGILQAYQNAGYSLSPHSLRHACASHCYNNGMPPGLVGKLLGHQDLRNTLIYCHCPQKRWQAELLQNQPNSQTAANNA